jgi:hypothetical protein
MAYNVDLMNACFFKVVSLLNILTNGRENMYVHCYISDTEELCQSSYHSSGGSPASIHNLELVVEKLGVGCVFFSSV